MRVAAIDCGTNSLRLLVADVPAAGDLVDVTRDMEIVRLGQGVDVGCVRMTERHLHGDPPSAAEIAAAEGDVGSAVDRALSAVGGRSGGTLVGLAGSVTTVAAIALGLDRYRPERIHGARIGYP